MLLRVRYIKDNIPDLQLVIIESSVNSNQHRGSSSVILDCAMLVLNRSFENEAREHTITGGSIAVAALGTT
jgi:hypothetical protein